MHPMGSVSRLAPVQSCDLIHWPYWLPTEDWNKTHVPWRKPSSPAASHPASPSQQPSTFPSRRERQQLGGRPCHPPQAQPRIDPALCCGIRPPVPEIGAEVAGSPALWAGDSMKLDVSSRWNHGKLTFIYNLNNKHTTQEPKYKSRGKLKKYPETGGNRNIYIKIYGIKVKVILGIGSLHMQLKCLQ